MFGYSQARSVSAAAIAVRLALLVGLWAGVSGFGSVEGLGQHSEHEKITRLALGPFKFGRETLDLLAGKRGSLGAVGAPDIRLAFEAAAHCDGGDHLDVTGYPQSKAEARAHLERCRAFIDASFLAAVSDAGPLADDALRIKDGEIPTLIRCSFTGTKGRAKCNVLEDLGLVFHAAQDFYSHTNWVDKTDDGATGSENPPGLGNNQPAPWLEPQHDRPVPDGLISGCFDGTPESAHCNEGDACVRRVKHQSLNKDNGDIDVRSGKIGAGATKRGRVNGNFARAVRAAIADTSGKWRRYEQRVRAVYGQ